MVKASMAKSTQPSDFKRFSVVRVMFLRLVSAYFARLRYQFSSSLISICVRPAIRLAFFFFGKQPMRNPSVSHVRGMTVVAVTRKHEMVLISIARVFHATVRANSYVHQTIILCFSGT